MGGMFSQLKDLNKNQNPKITKDSEVTQQPLSPTPKHAEEKKDSIKKPAKPQNRKTEDDLEEKPEKYTTRLEPSLIKRVKIFAAEKELKDYEVVKKALLEYFERNS